MKLESKTENEGDALDALATEIHGLVHHPRANEIFESGWLANAEVPIPSVEAICFMAAQFLNNPHIQDLAQRMPERAVIKKALVEARKNNLRSTRKYVAREKHFMDSDRLRMSEGRKHGRMHEWQEILLAFMAPGGPYPQGRRAVARGFLQALILRAVFHSDSEALRSLAEAVELLRKGERPQVMPVHRIASEILAWKNRLKEELGRTPSKGEMKAFLNEYYPGELSQAAETWASAWKLVGWSDKNDRKGKRDMTVVINLAKRIKSEPESCPK